MSAPHSEAETDINAAIAEAVEKALADPDLQRSVTKYLIGALNDLPPEERTSSIIDTIRLTLGEEDR